MPPGWCVGTAAWGHVVKGGDVQPAALVIHVHVYDVELFVELDFPEVGQFHFVAVAVAFQREDFGLRIVFFHEFRENKTPKYL